MLIYSAQFALLKNLLIYSVNRGVIKAKLGEDDKDNSQY